MIGIAAMGVTFWLVIGAVFVANSYFAHNVRMARYRVMQTLADKGQPVPLELLNQPGKPGGSSPVWLMRGGLVLISIGGALSIFFWSMSAQSIFHGPIESGQWLPTIGLFPLSIGIALVLLARHERSHTP
jgi:hypothetical protein